MPCPNSARKRSKTMAFRVSPEEYERITNLAKLSGMDKQDFILAKLMDHEIVVRPSTRVYKALNSASVLLGAGRQKKGDPLDFAAGITLHKKRGDYVHKGESLATFYGAADKFEAAAAEYRSGLVYGAEKPEEAPLVYALVTKDGVERY